MIALLTAGGLAMSLLVSPPAVEAAAAPDDISIEVVTANGSGCPVNTLGAAGVHVSSDGSRLSVSYPSFIAHLGISTVVDSRKNCQLNLRVNKPANFSYAVTRIDHQGYAHLADGAIARLGSSLYFQGQSQTERFEHQLNGPLNGAWSRTTQINPDRLVWQPCGEDRNLNLNVELRVNAGTSNPDTDASLITLDSTGVSTYHFEWRRCVA
jgi:hypothetical protein